VGIALAAIGTSLVVEGASTATVASRARGGNAPVNRGATDARDNSAHNSPTVASNPRRPQDVAVVDRVDTPLLSCALHLSFDGGVSFTDAQIPFPQGEEVPPRCFAPDLVFGADGTLYVSFVTLAGLGNVPHAAWVAASTDGGRRLLPPVRVAGPLAFQVRLSADELVPGRLYLSWLQAFDTALLSLPEPGNPIVVARSMDGGAHWSDPFRVSPPSRQRVVAPTTVVGRKGRLYVLYLDVDDDLLDYQGSHEGKGGEAFAGFWSLVLARSEDGGRTWREAPVERHVVPSTRFVVFLPPSPSLAVGRSGRDVYVTFADGRLGDPDVWIWVSRDGGDTFSAARRVNRNRTGDHTSQYLPSVAIAPDGRVDVVYYDRRRDAADVMNEVSLQSSYDHGRKFAGRLVLTDRPFDSRIGFGSERGLPDLGSRLGLVSSDRRALAVWADTRGGNQASNKQDLARQEVTFTAGRGLTGAVLGAWALIALAGASLLWSWLANRGRRRGDLLPPREGT